MGSVSSCLLCFFFFSSRRRHTRFDCDWSSDVCSSDLDMTAAICLYDNPSRSRSKNISRWPAGSRSSAARSEEHTSELQSQSNLVCRLLLEKKKKKIIPQESLSSDLQHIHDVIITSRGS